MDFQWRQSRGAGGGIPPIFPKPKKVRRGQILNIVMRLEIKNLEESDFLSIKIVNFSDFLPVRNTKSLTFLVFSSKECEKSAF